MNERVHVNTRRHTVRTQKTHTQNKVGVTTHFETDCWTGVEGFWRAFCCK